MTSSSKLIRRGAVAVVAIGVLTGAALPTLASNGDRTTSVRSAIKGGTARNVILLIGDGMGDSEITIARNYAKGAAGRLAMDTLPLTGEYTTYAVTKSDPSKPDYVTDPAASGPGWAPGHQTQQEQAAVRPRLGRERHRLVHRAQDLQRGDLGDAGRQAPADRTGTRQEG